MLSGLLLLLKHGACLLEQLTERFLDVSRLLLVVVSRERRLGAPASMAATSLGVVGRDD